PYTHPISSALRLLLFLLSLAHIINGETTRSPTSLNRLPVSISPLENTHNQPSFPQAIPFRQRRRRRQSASTHPSNTVEAETTPADSTTIILGDWRAIPHPSSHTVSTTLGIYTQFHRTLISNIPTEIFTTQTNNNTLTLTLGHLLLTITWNSDPLLLTPRSKNSSSVVTPKPKEVLDQLMMDLQNYALRGFIGLGKVFVFVRKLWMLTVAIRVLPAPRVWNIVN
ncbi:MAG: hypothetical protein LQ341_007728, partial [Variospora aurantia]